jgi:AcrR family transcriptional regulator
MIKTISHAGRDGRGGRPKAAELEQRDEHILCIAGETFLNFGFGGTTMDAVASAAGISKRTLYARYADKTVLFNAVLRDLIDRWLSTIEQFQTESGTLKDKLLALGRFLVETTLTPRSVGVNRIIICEAQRQSDFGHLVNEAGRKPAIRSVVSILRQHQTELRPIDLEMAAEQFMSLAVDRNLRLAFLGLEVDVEQWVCTSVDLFLAGIQGRDGRAAVKRIAGSGARKSSSVGRR